MAPGRSQPPLTFLGIAGSLRRASYNRGLIRAAAEVAPEGTRVIAYELADIPMYNADLEAEGDPEPIAAFKQAIAAADALLIATPEYNHCVPGVLKNAIDWVSRFRPQPFHERHGLLLSASPSMVGGNRGAWALRIPLEHLGARVYPDMFSLAQAHSAFAEDGQIADAQLQGRFETTIVNFMDLVEASKHYPCVKSAWVEYLGERPQPAIDRVQ
jgi:NAD(P)H-dependent FMN reductase